MHRALVDATKPLTEDASAPRADQLAVAPVQLAGGPDPRDPPIVLDARAGDPARPQGRGVDRGPSRGPDHARSPVRRGRCRRPPPRVRIPGASRPDAAAVRAGPTAGVGAAEPSRIQAGRFGHATRARCRIRPPRPVCGPLSECLRRVAFGHAAAQPESLLKAPSRPDLGLPASPSNRPAPWPRDQGSKCSASSAADSSGAAARASLTSAGMSPGSTPTRRRAPLNRVCQ